jgi:hypothetical protein
MPTQYMQMVEPAVPPGDEAAACTFTFLKADFVRAYSGTRLPMLQEMREKHPDALEKVTFTYKEVAGRARRRDRLRVAPLAGAR